MLRIYLCSLLNLVIFVSICGTVQAEPVLALSSQAVPPMGMFAINGSGFGDGKLIDIYFDTEDDCLAVSDSLGKFKCSLKIPANAQPVVHRLTAVERMTGLSAQKSLLVRTNWSHFHGLDSNRRGYNYLENTLKPANVANLDILWRKPTEGIINSAPVVADGRVYVGASDGKLYSFNAITGATASGFPVATAAPVLEIESSPVVVKDTVYVSPADSRVYAFNAKTGIPKPGFPVKFAGISNFASPAVADGIVYIGGTHLYAFNADTGAVIAGFPKKLDNNISSSPTVANGMVYIANGNKLLAFNAKTGTRIFASFLGGFSTSSAPALANGIVYIGASDGKLYAFNAFTGVRIAGFPVSTGGGIFSTPAIGRNIVYAGSFDHRVYAWNATTGSKLWSFTADSEVHTPEVANGVLYVPSQNILYALDAKSGTLLWGAAVDASRFNGSPSVVNGILYMGSVDRHLYAFSLNGLPVALASTKQRPNPLLLVP